MEQKTVKPDCYKCSNRRSVPGDAHSSCVKKDAQITANRHGVLRGWFSWPFNFDPVWLESCDSFSDKEENR